MFFSFCGTAYLCIITTQLHYISLDGFAALLTSKHYLNPNLLSPFPSAANGFALLHPRISRNYPPVSHLVKPSFDINLAKTQFKVKTSVHPSIVTLSRLQMSVRNYDNNPFLFSCWQWARAHLDFGLMLSAFSFWVWTHVERVLIVETDSTCSGTFFDCMRRQRGGNLCGELPKSISFTNFQNIERNSKYKLEVIFGLVQIFAKLWDFFTTCFFFWILWTVKEYKISLQVGDVSDWLCGDHAILHRSYYERW